MVLTISYENDGLKGRYTATLKEANGDKTEGTGATADAAVVDVIRQLTDQLELAAAYVVELGGSEDGFDAFVGRR